MIVLVCGGRDFKDRDLLFGTLDRLMLDDEHGIERIIHGGASGADTLAGEWAMLHEVVCEVYPAKWKTHGRKAGPIRNQQMLDEAMPDVVVAMPGGFGTSDMVLRARRAEVYRIIEVERKNETPKPSAADLL